MKIKKSQLKFLIREVLQEGLPSSVTKNFDKDIASRTDANEKLKIWIKEKNAKIKAEFPTVKSVMARAGFAIKEMKPIYEPMSDGSMKFQTKVVSTKTFAVKQKMDKGAGYSNNIEAIVDKIQAKLPEGWTISINPYSFYSSDPIGSSYPKEIGGSYLVDFWIQ